MRTERSSAVMGLPVDVGGDGTAQVDRPGSMRGRQEIPAWDEDPQQRVDTGVRTGPTAPRVDFEGDVTPAGEVDDPATGALSGVAIGTNSAWASSKTGSFISERPKKRWRWRRAQRDRRVERHTPLLPRSGTPCTRSRQRLAPAAVLGEPVTPWSDLESFNHLQVGVQPPVPGLFAQLGSRTNCELLSETRVGEDRVQRLG